MTSADLGSAEGAKLFSFTTCGGAGAPQLTSEQNKAALTLGKLVGVTEAPRGYFPRETMVGPASPARGLQGDLS